MAVNKVVVNTDNGEQTLIDLTEDSVTPEALTKGATAHNAKGEQITGTMRKVDELLESVNVYDTLLWDGNTEEKQSFSLITTEGTLTYYNVSENVITFDDLKNGYILEMSDLSETMSAELKVTDIEKVNDTVIFDQSIPFVVFVLEDNATLYGSTIPKKGIYFIYSEITGYVSRIKIEGYAGFDSEIEVIKNKYIPEHSHSWNDLADDIKQNVRSYVTDEVKGAVVQALLAELQGLPIFGVIGEDNNIEVRSLLADGTYVLNYEDEDGNIISKICTVTEGTGTGEGSGGEPDVPDEPDVIEVDIASIGYTDNARWSVTDGTIRTGVSGYTAINKIPFTRESGQTMTITLSGITWTDSALSSKSAAILLFVDDNFTSGNNMYLKDVPKVFPDIGLNGELNDDGTLTFKIFDGTNGIMYNGFKVCGVGTGANAKITYTIE